MPRFDWRERGFGDRARPSDRREREGPGLADYSRDWRYDPETRTGYRADERPDGREDYGQADYSRDWDYDRERGRSTRRDAGDDADRHDDRYRNERYDHEPRSWVDRAGDFLAGRGPPADERRYPSHREFEERRDDRRYDERRARRRGPSDRVLWAVIVERLEDARSLDLRDVEVLVEDAEVTLNGSVRRKEDKRRIEDIADVEGVHNVQNNLRIRDRPRWTFL